MSKEIQHNRTLALQLVPNVSVTERQHAMLCDIVHAEEWNHSKMKELYKADKHTFNYLLNNITEILAFEDLDRYMERVGVIYPEVTKNTLWQHNHIRILNAISNLTRRKDRFPSRQEISNETNLSKHTVNKHLKTYFGSELYTSKRDEYIVLRETVLAKVFALAIEGDTKAAKVFLDSTNQFVEAPKIRNQQNNFIQINGLTITQEELKQLPAGKLTQLQKILSDVSKPVNQA